MAIEWDKPIEWEARLGNNLILVKYITAPGTSYIYRLPSIKGRVTWYARNAGKKRWLKQYSETENSMRILSAHD